MFDRNTIPLWLFVWVGLLVPYPVLAAGTVSGTVVDTSNNPLPNISIRPSQWNCRGWNSKSPATTDASGHYELDLADGVYRITFRDDSGTYVSHTTAEMTVTDGSTTSGIDAQLVLDDIVLGGSIDGTVTNASGTPVERIEVTVYRSNGNDWDSLYSTTTNTSGHYRFSDLKPGIYRLRFSDGNRPKFYMEEYYNHAATLDEGTDIQVIAENTTSVPFVLNEGGHITGTVTDSNNNPLSNVQVVAYSQDGNHWSWEGYTGTNTNGHYELQGLSSGEYALQFRSSTHITEYYTDDAQSLNEATKVVVLAGQTTTGIHAQLAPGGSISGTVTDLNTNPLNRIWVEAYDTNGSWQNSIYTNNDGNYTLGGLETGSYRLAFSDYDDVYAIEYYLDKGTLETATEIQVTVGQTTASVNAQIALAGHITGTVTGQDNKPLSEVDVVAWECHEGRCRSKANARTDDTGHYDLSGLGNTDYQIRFSCQNSDLPDKYYDDASSRSDATNVSVTAGQTTADINAQLAIVGGSTPTVPAAPSSFTATIVSQTEVTLNWADNSDNETGFKIFRNGTELTPSPKVAADITQFNDTGLTCGTTYAYKVIATNANGNSTAASVNATTQACPAVPPSAPVNLTATAVSDNQVNLNWTDNSQDETGFKIFRNGTELTPSPKVAADITQFNDTGLTCGTTYAYEVKATNANGDSVAISASATTQVCPPTTVSYTLTIPTTGTGNGHIAGTEAGSHTEGTSVTLTAVADTGSEFKAWTPAICEKTFILTSDFTCTAEFVLKPQVPEIDLVTSDFCELNPDYLGCQLVDACQENPNDCFVSIQLIEPTAGQPTPAVENSIDLSQPSISPIIDIIGLKASFTAHGDNLNDGTQMAVADCENMLLLPGGNNAKRRFFCTQWGLPGIKKGVVKDQHGEILYDFEVDARYDCKAVTEIPVAECEILYELYNQTHGKDWKNAATNKWLIDVTPCGWEGITCANGHVTQLRLADNNLSGELPDLCPLTELEELDLSNNAVKGKIPRCLSKLKLANLFGTQAKSVIANVCKWSQALDWCKETSDADPVNPDPLKKVVDACQQTANSPICEANIKFVPSPTGFVPVIATEPNQSVVIDYVGLPVSFTVVGSELNDDIGMTVEDCSDVRLLPEGTITEREFYCMQWGLPGLKKGAFKKADGHLLYGFDVDTQYVCEAVTEIPLAECQTLLALYNNTQGKEWKSASTNKWLGDIQPCGWSGITCENGRITEIDLKDNQLSGSFPDLSALTHLESLDLAHNQLSGSIQGLSTLTALTLLNLSANQLTGSIPELSGLTHLSLLYLQNNQLSGEIPDLSALTALSALSLRDNQLSGSFPDFSSASSTLELLYLDNNQLCGEIPHSLASLAHISDFDAAANQVNLSISHNHLGTYDSALIAFLDNKEPDWAATQTPAEGCEVVAPTTSTTPQRDSGVSTLPDIAPDDSINGVYNNTGGTVTEDFTVEGDGSVSNLVIKGKVINHGMMSNVTIEEGAELIGGKVSGYITNHGLVRDFEFVGATLTGGTLSGHIDNNSQVGGRFIDVTLLADTVIEGGILEGQIQGDCEAPALLKNLTVKKNSHLSCVILGDNVVLEDGVVVVEIGDEDKDALPTVPEVTIPPVPDSDTTVTGIIKPKVYITTNSYLYSKESPYISVYVSTDVEGAEMTEELYDIYVAVGGGPDGLALFDPGKGVLELTTEAIPYSDNVTVMESDWVETFSYEFTEDASAGDYFVHIGVLDQKGNLVSEDSVDFLYDPDYQDPFIAMETSAIRSSERTDRAGSSLSDGLKDYYPELKSKLKMYDVVSSAKDGLDLLEEAGGIVSDYINNGKDCDIDETQRDFLLVAGMMEYVLNTYSVYKGANIKFAGALKEIYKGENQRLIKYASVLSGSTFLKFEHVTRFFRIDSAGQRTLKVEVKPIFHFPYQCSSVCKKTYYHQMSEARKRGYNFEVQSKKKNWGDNRHELKSVTPGAYSITATDTTNGRVYRTNRVLKKLGETVTITFDYDGDYEEISTQPTGIECF